MWCLALYVTPESGQWCLKGLKSVLKYLPGLAIQYYLRGNLTQASSFVPGASQNLLSRTP
jgi:hypothetical protein